MPGIWATFQAQMIHGLAMLGSHYALDMSGERTFSFTLPVVLF